MTIPFLQCTRKNSFTELAILNFTAFKILGKLFAIWPLSEKASKREIRVQIYIWCCLHINFWLLLFPTIAELNHVRHDVVAVAYTSTQFIVIFETIYLMIFFRLQQSRFRVLLETSYDFIAYAKGQVFHKVLRHATKYVFIFFIMVGLYVIVGVLIIFKSTFSKPVTLPIGAHYFFSLESRVVWYLFYIHQMIGLLYAVVIIFSDSYVVLMIFVSVVKLDLLKSKFERIRFYSDLAKCIREHQEIIWFIKEVNHVVKYLILKTIFCIGIQFFTEGLKLFTKDLSWFLQIQFLILFMICFFRLYLYAFCAECMAEMGHDLGFAVYSSFWYEQTRKMIINKSIVICRCQKPLCISISGIVPSLNKKYLSRFLYIMFSYLMTLRAITRDKT